MQNLLQCYIAIFAGKLRGVVYIMILKIQRREDDSCGFRQNIFSLADKRELWFYAYDRWSGSVKTTGGRIIVC